MQESKENHDCFLAAWKRGVEFLGPGQPETARDRNELRPLKEKIEAVFAKESGGEEQLLSAMVSFYDPPWGADRIECDKSVCGLT